MSGAPIETKRSNGVPAGDTPCWKNSTPLSKKGE